MPRKTITKQQLAYEKIKEAIITEKYKTNQLLSSRELSEKLGISRTPVTEALRRLAYEGFVDAVPDKGMFVSEIHIEDYLEIYEIRLGLEGIAARLCAKRKTDELIKKMDSALSTYEKEYRKGNYLKAIHKDNEFHSLIISGSNNSRIKKYMKIIMEQCGRAVTLSASDPERMENELIPAHRKIYEAIAAGNSEGAEAAIRQHILDVMDFFTRYQIKHRYSL